MYVALRPMAAKIGAAREMQNDAAVRVVLLSESRSNHRVALTARLTVE